MGGDLGLDGGGPLRRDAGGSLAGPELAACVPVPCRASLVVGLCCGPVAGVPKPMPNPVRRGAPAPVAVRSIGFPTSVDPVGCRSIGLGVPAPVRVRSIGGPTSIAPVRVRAGFGSPAPVGVRSIGFGVPAPVRVRSSGFGVPAPVRVLSIGFGVPAPVGVRSSGLPTSVAPVFERSIFDDGSTAVGCVGKRSIGFAGGARRMGRVCSGCVAGAESIVTSTPTGGFPPVPRSI